MKAFWHWWHKTPLYIRILLGLVVGVVIGLVLKGDNEKLEHLRVPSDIILRMLRTLAPPLILVAVIRALMGADLKGQKIGKMVRLLLTNTLAAIFIGLFVANVVQPGHFAKKMEAPAKKVETDPVKQKVLEVLKENNVSLTKTPKDPLGQFLDNVPRSLLEPLNSSDKVLGVIFIAVAFGMAFRAFRDKPLHTLSDLMDVLLESLIKILHWIVDVVPIGVMGVVAHVLGTKGTEPFKALGVFVLTVILALTLQGVYYLLRIRLQSWVRPMRVIRGMNDALMMAFSTASSTASMPLTYECLKDKVKIREESASLGALVGSNFNNDGTALYEAMAALFISQMLGISLSLPQQFMVVVTSIIASVGAAGIPEAGLVTMTLVFTSVGLPPDFIPILLTVDWFLDRCRTTLNVMGDVTVSCILDGKIPEDREDALEGDADRVETD